MLNGAEKSRNSAYLGVSLLIGGSGFFILALEIYILSSNQPSPHLYCKNVLGFIGGTTNISSYTITREGELDYREGEGTMRQRADPPDYSMKVHWYVSAFRIPFDWTLSHKPGLALWIYTYRATFPAHFSAAVEHSLTRNLKSLEDGHGF